MASSAPSARSVYVAASTNRASNVSAARVQDGLIAFGSGRFVALWNSSDENSNGVHETLPGHQGAVTALKFLQSKSTSRFFVSGDSVGVVRVWKEEDNKWSTVALLTGHTQSISAVAGLELVDVEGDQNHFLVLTGGSDGLIQSWLLTPAGPELLQKIDLKGKIPLELALSLLPASSSVTLAIGSTENRIQVYSSSSTGKINFTKSLSLDGHSDWVRCLSFTTPIPASSNSSISYDISPGEVLLASGSQDNYIRLWRFSRISHQPQPTTTLTSSTGLDALDELEQSLADGELRVKAHDFVVSGDGEFSCSSEAVLLGHDAWVTGLHWAPHLPSQPLQQLQLLSSSADRSMILWTPTSSDPSSSSSSSPAIWTSFRRFGEFSSATNLGFFGALWGKDGRTVLASGWGGSWHVWRKEDDEGEWEPVVATAGHFGEVKSLAWEPEGAFLLSAGADMSTRLHAPWRRTSGDTTIETWHELGRPQIHGYPIASIAFTGRLQFVSGADEKIVRVFDAPKVFLSSLKKLAGVDLGDEESRPMAANVPPLGLSNRAIATSAEAEEFAPASNDPFDALLPVNFTVASHPPFEEQLLGSTLWPETEKLYGHGFEIIALAAAHQSPVIATACKATSPEHAVIRLYDTKSWKPVGSILAGHALTITSMKFSSNDRWLLSVSRDRTWRLFEKAGDDYQPSATAKSHTRIIWDACWAGDDSFFATASRDKTVKIWTSATSSSDWSCTATLKFDGAATAVAATVIRHRSCHLLAVGLENGQIHLFTSPFSDPAVWTPWLALDSSISHVLTVTSLAFCPKVQGSTIKLASGSDDRSVRIIEVST